MRRRLAVNDEKKRWELSIQPHSSSFPNTMRTLAPICEKPEPPRLQPPPFVFAIIRRGQSHLRHRFRVEPPPFSLCHPSRAVSSSPPCCRRLFVSLLAPSTRYFATKHKLCSGLLEFM
ncbi:hypothetical protein PIB30_031005 [Stylosanthes scabra]|uniref:Uncharacterized protein n=1 Tax=Stylosanthes scabra TaxID=79078 RepID=A0ABU6WCQ1_9FABA|nr:hypothetical protein [Stylosanthes scabra]